MKILMRWYCGDAYVWVTAKYDGNGFVVEGEKIDECDIVSIINDNRKNYVKCSSCGKIFPKNGKKFAKHKAESSTITPCLKCNKRRVSERTSPDVRFIPNTNGTFTEKSERIVDLMCHAGLWTDYKCDSTEAIRLCKFRQCGSARAKEIEDTFTKYPGLFDDIITVDKILDNGDMHINWSDSCITEYQLDEEVGLSAHVNNLGIVDRFYIDNPKGCYYVWYSKRYDEFFWCEYVGYSIWRPDRMDDADVHKIKETIRNLYK